MLDFQAKAGAACYRLWVSIPVLNCLDSGVHAKTLLPSRRVAWGLFCERVSK